MFERAWGVSLPRGESDVSTRTDGCRLLIASYQRGISAS